MTEQNTKEAENVHITVVPLRWNDFDRYGHVTNSVYIELAQEARQIMAYEEFHSKGLEIPTVFVRHIDAEYLRPLLAETTAVTVESTISRIGTTSFTTRQEIKDRSGALCAVITVTQVAVDLQTASPREITAQELHILTKVAYSAQAGDE